MCRAGPSLMAGHVPLREMTQASFDGNQPARYSALGMGASIQSGENTEVIMRRVVAGIKREGENTVCRFNDGGSVHLANRLAALIRPGDEITFPLANEIRAKNVETALDSISANFSQKSENINATFSYA